MKLNKQLSLLLSGALIVSALAGCGGGTDTSSDSESASASQAGSVSSGASSDSYVLPNLMVLSGPTGVGAAKLMADNENVTPDAVANGAAAPVINTAAVEADNQMVSSALINGDVDIAAVATNVAANLSAKSEGAIQVLAVNTLGVLYILEKGDSVQSMADLAGRTVYATGQGANPEFVLNYLLTENGVDPAEVDIQWMTPQEVTAKMASSDDGICMLPVPAATALMLQDSGVRQALSLTGEWSKVSGGQLAMGCIVARTDYIEENPLGVENFLTAYQDSISYMSDPANLEDAAQLVAQYGITPNAAIAKAAIPQCNLVCLTGEEMKSVLEDYYQVLYDADPASIGGALPYDSFYYGAS
ncbi:MAG: ABC transporter substrate-binding protein [Oscillospiraceae bacterium]|jgi:NitT/TauT family transport system substrate-binding protein|nr:ABC transporter substrate-binding protein [Oscillospiraceae bacterium]